VNYINAAVNKYVVENSNALKHVWLHLDHLKSTSLPLVSSKEFQEFCASMKDVDMIAAGQNLITLLEMVPNEFASKCVQAVWPATDDKDLSGVKVDTHVLGFAARFIIVLKGVNSFNANRNAWLNCSLAPDAQYYATISNARLEISVAPQVQKRGLICQKYDKTIGLFFCIFLFPKQRRHVNLWIFTVLTV
jgi:hypothetical protein